MAENKRLQTRLMLKYDSYENWTGINPSLLKGEVAIAVIDVADKTQTHSGQAVPQLLMKVGNGLEGEAGRYNSLPFVSGLAADVHSWAKSANKPTYGINEISGAKEYQVVKAKKTVDGVEVDDEFKYILQARKAQSSDAWTDVSTIDMAKIEAGIAAIEGRMTTAEGKITTSEGTVGDADLKALMGENGKGSVADRISDAINALDTPEGGVSQTAGADGLALNIVQTNGVITSISGSIAANTYDAHGAAAAVEGKLNEYKTSNDTAVQAAASAAAAAQKAADDEKAAREAAIEGLDFTGVEGIQTGTEIKFVNKVSQTNGVVSAELGTLEFQTAVSADNKAATMSDVRGAVADLNGAMHFEGFTSTDPAIEITIEGKPDYVAAAGDVVIYNTVEYVYDGSKWQKLGEEGALGAAIEALDATISIEDTDNKNPLNITIVEEDGKLVSVTGSIDDVFDAKGAADAAIKTLNLNEVAGVQTGTEIKFINKVAQTNGAVSAEVGTILVNTAYSADNKIATMADIIAAEGEVGKDVEALEKRVEANENAITTLNGADSVANSVANKIKVAIEALDKADTAVAGQFVTAVSEENGIITVSRGAVNVKDLEQTTDTYVVFNCGSATEVM